MLRPQRKAERKSDHFLNSGELTLQMLADPVAVVLL